MDAEVKKAIRQIELCQYAINETEVFLGKLTEADECGLYIDSNMLSIGKKTMLYFLRERIKLLKMYRNELNNFIKQ